jgi:hypothetical protein
MVEVRSVANSDSDLSGYHDIDERNGVPLPLHQTAAVANRRHDFIGDAGVRNVRALRQAPFRHLASDLHGHRPAIYLDVFVLLVQAFLKIPLLKAWAPTQTELAFLVAQGSAFLLFFVLTILVTVRFRPGRVTAR